MGTPDAIDLRLLRELVADPRLPVSELAVRAGVVRNTAQARLERLTREGVLGRNERHVDLRALGFAVSAVVSITVRHSEIDLAVQTLAGNRAVLQVDEVAGASGDLLVRVACRSTDELQKVVHSLLSTPGVVSGPARPERGTRTTSLPSRTPKGAIRASRPK